MPVCNATANLHYETVPLHFQFLVFKSSRVSAKDLSLCTPTELSIYVDKDDATFPREDWSISDVGTTTLLKTHRNERLLKKVCIVANSLRNVASITTLFVTQASRRHLYTIHVAPQGWPSHFGSGTQPQVRHLILPFE